MPLWTPPWLQQAILRLGKGSDASMHDCRKGRAAAKLLESLKRSKVWEPTFLCFEVYLITSHACNMSQLLVMHFDETCSRLPDIFASKSTAIVLPFSAKT